MPYVAVPDHLAGDVFTLANWQTHIEGNLNAGVERPLFDSGILGVAAASVDITSIPATFAHLRLVAVARGDTAATTTDLRMRFNNDTAASYFDAVGQDTDVAHSTSGNFTAVSSMICGRLSAATAIAGYPGVVVIDIPGYAGTTFTKGFVSQSYNFVTNGTGGEFVRVHGGTWNGNAAVNRITLFPNAGNFAAGSRVTLYGMGGM